MEVSVILIAFNNPVTVRERIRDVRAAAEHCKLKTEVIVVDNGKTPAVELGDACDQYVRNVSQPHAGPAIHLGVHLARAPVSVYACTHHLRITRPDWLKVLTHPVAHEGSALAGDLRSIGFGPVALRLGDVYPDDDPMYRLHIQGGVWAGDTKILRQFPPLPQYPHGYEDIVRSWALMKAGHKLTHVPSVFSTGVRGHVCPDDSPYCVIHDYKQ